MSLAIVLIVKNEDSIIERLADSVKGIADTTLILDTGSTDSTIETAKKLFTNCAVIEEPWTSFGEARTSALSHARTMADWSLMVDADFVIEYHEDFKSWLDAEATADSYMVEIREHGTQYRLPLLVNNRVEWRYEGVTHEYLVGAENSQFLNGLVVHHLADGANRTFKHQRDIELLAAGADGGDPRSVFYTAQAYWCLSDFSEAFWYYSKRAEMVETWEEERWYAQFMAGRSALHLDESKGIALLLEAAAARPQRGEPLKVLSDWFASRLPVLVPQNESLFIDMSAYRC